MNKIEVLDCTLRDGGYVNNWAFGENNIVKILKNLQLSNIDIIECGFLSKKKEANVDNSIFNTIVELEKIIPSDKKNCKFVCMVNFGDINISNIPASKESCVDGIRVAFHKKDLYEAMIFCEEISKKGYLVFIQPMVTISYSDNEVLELIALSNKINPYALYIADSFGVMKRDDLLRLIYLFHHNLISGINLGYHAHNNLQCAFSNAEAFIELNLNRNIIIDSSVYGMGRGAGNLNTELLVNYLNSKFDKNYIIQPILKSIDECINKIYSDNSWGYSLPHFLSASYNCHPNYASHLIDKNTLTIEKINIILSRIITSRKNSFDVNYIEKLYIDHQINNIDDSQALIVLKERLIKQDVLVIAPGHSILEYKESIDEIISKMDPIIVSTNYIPNNISCNYTFVSNSKRFEQLIDNNKYIDTNSTFILTSNIQTEIIDGLVINHESLLNEIHLIEDNAVLMFIKLLSKVGVNKVFLAGFDGYSTDNLSNYVSDEVSLSMNKNLITELNENISKIIKEMSKVIRIEFITPTKYIKEEK